MKLFKIKTNLPKEKIEEAIMSACASFKLGEIYPAYEGEKFTIWDIVKGEEKPRCMAYLTELSEKGEFRNKYWVHIWGKPIEQEEIMSVFLKNLNITKDDITYK